MSSAITDDPIFNDPCFDAMIGIGGCDRCMGHIDDSNTNCCDECSMKYCDKCCNCKLETKLLINCSDCNALLCKICRYMTPEPRCHTCSIKKRERYKKVDQNFNKYKMYLVKNILSKQVHMYITPFL